MRTSLVSAAAAAVVAAAANPVVNITAGQLLGGTCSNNARASFFKSIPYAQPPIDSLRFAPPQPYTQTYEGGSRNATQAAPSCIQFGSSLIEKDNNSEDCLYVDIWAPTNATKDSALPVRVWIYGGSNTAGGISDPLYDGCNVPDTGALMVSINYRVGPLGFLALEESQIGGNQGIQDILLGLQWVQDNIAAFGGDPKKVVLHGQSAGATDTFVIATLPQAPDLFSSVIFQSGGGRNTLLKDHTELLGQEYAKALNCSISNSTCLKSASIESLRDVFESLPLLHTRSLATVGIDNIDAIEFGPYVDGQIVPVQPSKSGVNVPAIFGSNSQDGALFAFLQFADAPEGPASATAENYTTFLTENFGSAAPLIEKYYPLSAFNASPFPAVSAISTVLTTASYLCPMYRGANTAVAKNIPVWTYLFAHSPKCAWLPGIPNEALPLLGAAHTSEIPFVLDNAANLPLPDGNCSMSTDEQALAAFISQAWTTFAATQQPADNSSLWPAYGGSNDTIGITFINKTVAGKIDFSACKLWDEIDAMQVAAANNGSYAGSGTNVNGSNTTTTNPTSGASSSVSPLPSTGAAGSIRMEDTIAMLGVAIAGATLL